MLNNKIEFPKRFNIHAQFDNCSLAQIVELNKEINRLCSSEIIFDQDSPHIPHITLLMGNLFDIESLNQVCNSLGRFAKETEEFTYSISKYKLMEPEKKYLFAFPEPSLIIYEIKKNLFKTVGEFLTFDKHGTQNTIPHLTLAYFKENNDTLAKVIKFKRIIGKINKIAIAETGRKGTCVNIIEEFNLLS